MTPPIPTPWPITADADEPTAPQPHPLNEDGGQERLAWGRAELDAWAKRQAQLSAQAGVPVRDSVWNLQPSGKTPEEALLRSADPRWWRRAGARQLRQAREAALLAAGSIGHDGQRYASDVALAWHKDSQVHARRFARDSVIFDLATGHMQPLEERLHHPRQLAARYYAFLKGIEALAVEAGLRWAMLTITLPSAWHARPKHHDGQHRWNGQLPDAGHREIAQGWHRLRMQLRKHGIILSGVRTEEPMQDGTPHWHCAFFFKSDDELRRICQATLTQFPAGLRIREAVGTRAGKLQFRIRQYDSLDDFRTGRFHRNARRGAQCQLDLGAPRTPGTEGVVASFASYVLKYVAKACGVGIRPRQGQPGEQPAADGQRTPGGDATAHSELAGEQDDSLIDSGPAARVRAHRSTWGIRGIEFYGIPKGAASCWDLLRQVRLDDEAERAALDPAVAELAEVCQRDKGQGFAEYLRLLGGLACSPMPARYVVKPLRVKVATQYGGEGERLVGVQVQDVARSKTARALVRPLGRQLLRKQAAEALAALTGEGLARQTVAEQGGQGSAAGALVHIATVETSQVEPGSRRPQEDTSSAQQRQAIELPVDGHHAVLAAAGSGKTHLLVERAAWLLQQGVPAHKLVLTTFTREAAEHLRERLHARGVHGVQVGTMHALARHWLGIKGGEPDFDAWLLRSAEQGRQDKWLLVDEAQDLSEAQWAWVEAHGHTVFAVGDERQAIYAWRGAKAGGLTQWARQCAPTQDALFDNLRSAALSVNRRCAAPIVALANALPLGMPATQALHAAGSVQLQRCVSREAELETIVAWLSDTLTARDAAVLVRSNAEVAWLKARLKLRGIDAPVMTIHASKGREWDAVVLALGMRKPSETADDALQTWYVGITRAKRQLLLTSVGLLPQALEDAWAAVRGGQATAAPQDGTFASRGTADVQEVGQRADAGT
ncbi:UvrD-helicase domain-containing protein [Tepidimonas sp. HKU77]|uniref:UvrD-helicase domain-containing protein n=1 Tax=Tepidimonas sp. HKU77 TaxID=3414503 RepID=UPI003C7B377A